MKFLALFIATANVSSTHVYTWKQLDHLFVKKYVKSSYVASIEGDVIFYRQESFSTPTFDSACKITTDKGEVVTVEETCSDLVGELNK